MMAATSPADELLDKLISALEGYVETVALERINPSDYGTHHERLEPREAIADFARAVSPTQPPPLDADDEAETSEAPDEPCDRNPRRTTEPRPTAEVVLFKPSGKYYTEEMWRIPTEEEARAAGMTMRGDMATPWLMRWSPDFRQISGGPVLVVDQEPWGYPHLIGTQPGAGPRAATKTGRTPRLLPDGTPELEF